MKGQSMNLEWGISTSSKASFLHSCWVFFLFGRFFVCVWVSYFPFVCLGFHFGGDGVVCGFRCCLNFGFWLVGFFF